MQDTSIDTPEEQTKFHRTPGRFNRNGQHWFYLGITILFFILSLLLVVNFFITGQFNLFLFCMNLIGLLATMYCHTRYFRRNGERAPWHSWKLFQVLRK